MITLIALTACSDNEVGVYNTAPSAAITSPGDGARFTTADLVELRGVAQDAQDDATALDVFWSSSLQGDLGQVAPDIDGNVFLAVNALVAGTHAITLQVVDADGSSANDTVSIAVDQGLGGSNAPVVVIVGPADASVHTEGADVNFVASVTDPNQAFDTLNATLVSDLAGELWTGTPGANGSITVPWVASFLGTHAITLFAEDAGGNVSADSISIEVQDDGRPTAEILSPLATDTLWTDVTVPLQGQVGDAETDTELLVVRWESDLDGLLAEGPPDSAGFTASGVGLTEGTHLLTLTVLDEEAKEGSDSVLVQVIDPLHHDGDGDGFTEADGDCDDTDDDIAPSRAEECDLVDNDCDGQVNEDWWDSYEPAETSGAAAEIGEVDDGILWMGSHLDVSGLVLHGADDEDWYTWFADDEWYDNVSIDVRVGPFPSRGTYVAELYRKSGSSFVLEDSGSTGSGSAYVTLSFVGELLETDEDDFAIRVYSSTWDADACGVDYALSIDS